MALSLTSLASVFSLLPLLLIFFAAAVGDDASDATASLTQPQQHPTVARLLAVTLSWPLQITHPVAVATCSSCCCLTFFSPFSVHGPAF